MNMIEVDPKLFITCRLCVEETGVYQIVPEVQKKIKYCFDLDISLYDGLPPLICKKCELMLSHHAQIKERLHEKQKNLIKKIKENPITEEQTSELPVLQVDVQNNDDKNCNQNKKGNSLKSKKCKLKNRKKSSIDKSSPHPDNTEPVPFKNVEPIPFKNVEPVPFKNVEPVPFQKVESVPFKNVEPVPFKNVETVPFKNVETVPFKNVETVPFKNVETVPFKNVEPVPFKKLNKSVQNGWRKNYKRQFVCRFCSISFRHKRSMVCHGERCVLMQKYADVYKSCWVKVTNINSKCNFTESTDHIVYEKNKIVNTNNPNYYVIYSLKPEKKKSSSESSDENFTKSKKKRKRQRLISESSNDTLVIDNVLDKENNKIIYNTQRDIECVTLDDSDNASTVSTVTMKPDNLKNERLVNNIISICHSKYLKKYVGCNYSKICSNEDEGNLQRKLLSIGRKIIHKDGFNQTGLLRYMEQKDLDVIWTPKLETNVSIRTTLRENKQYEDEHNLKSLSLIDNKYKPRDFVDIFEQKCMSETNSTKNNLIFCNDNVVQEELSNKEMECVHSNDNQDSSSNYIVHSKEEETAKKTNLIDTTKVNAYEKVIKNNVLYLQAPIEITNFSNVKKLLNTNPVANPKKLTKKAVLELTTNSNKNGETNVNYITADSSSVFDKCSRLPIITSTVSLALSANNVNSSDQSPPGDEAAKETAEAPLPRIKVKPVSELMAAASDKPKGAPAPANVWAGNANDSQQQFIPRILPNLLLTQSPVYVSLVEPNNVTFPQFQTSQTNNFTQVTYNNSVQAPPQVNNNREYITMHTVELPRKRTHSPFLYFKELLQIHNMNLIDSAEPTSHMCCIIKFKLRFEQAGIASVTLCLSLLCYMNTFCIQVKDLQSRILDVNDFSAYWQWEVLKGFKGDVISMMLQNAKKYSNDILEKTTYFVTLLSNITVTTV